jgi:hypothetical protein
VRAHHLDPRGAGDADGAPTSRRRDSFATTTTTSDERRATDRIDGDAVPEVRDDDDDDDDGRRTNRIESNRIESIAARRVDRAIETTMRRPSRDDATATVARVDARRAAIDG